MKEIIYLDTDLMNSMLAQLDEGLINSFSLESSGQETEGESITTARGKSAGLSANIKLDTGLLPGGSLGFNSSLGNSGNESSNYSKAVLEGQKDILNKAFHDYALELLTMKLNENDLLIINDILKEGDLHLGESAYRFYDFDLMQKSMDSSFMEKIMFSDTETSKMSYKQAQTIINKPKPTAKDRELREDAQKVIAEHETIQPILEIFDKMNALSSFASKLLQDLTIIKTKNKIGLLKKEFLRESVESLTFRTDKSRKVKYLVRIIGKKEKVFDGTNIALLNESDLDAIPNMMLDVILGSFKIINKGDVLVTPIAIYYE